MLKCVDSRAHDAAIKLNSFINEFSMHEIESFRKYFRAIELHSLALKSDSAENQLLNLWVGLETLVPSKLSANKAKINNIIDSTLPFLSLVYVYSLTDRLSKDFRKYDYHSFLTATNSISGENDRVKLLKLLLLQQHCEAKNRLFDELGNYHLLRYRAYYFSQCLSSTKKISKLLRTHWERVDWQIRRIYRTRNQIVHAGYTPSYTDILIKNLHDYFDIVTNGIMYYASMGNKINTVEQAFKYSEIKCEDYLKELERENRAIDASNIRELIIEKRI